MGWSPSRPLLYVASNDRRQQKSCECSRKKSHLSLIVLADNARLRYPPLR